jgi:hypothetical protein
MTRWFILVTIVFSVVIAAGCGKKQGKSSEDGEAASGDGALIVKADLTSPKAAFESFAETMEVLRKRFETELESLFMASEADMYAPVMTAELVAFLKEREKKHLTGRTDSDEGKLVFEKEEKGEGEDVLIHATQKVTRKKMKRDPKTGVETTETDEQTKKHKILFVKGGEEWRIKTWHEFCTSCEGKGTCSECDGTGKTKPKECFMCKGSKKSDSGEKCFGCEGTGKEKPRDCYRCKETEGKCDRCEGEGWRRQDDFEGGGFFIEEEKTAEKYSDLSTPENTAKTYLNLEEMKEADSLTTLRGLTGSIRAMVKALFTADTLERLEKNLAKSAEEYKKKEGGKKEEVGKHEMMDGKAVVVIAETRTDREGKAHISRTALCMIQVGSDWKIDDRGQQCWGCEGTGKCGGCEGTGTTKPTDCFSCKGKGKDKDGKDCWACEGSGKTKPSECFQCKEDKGNCNGCKGAKFTWDREKKEGK